MPPSPYLEAAAAHAKGHAVHVDAAGRQRQERRAGAGRLGVGALPGERVGGADVGEDGGGDGDGAAAALADVGGEGRKARVRVDGLVGDVDGPAQSVVRARARVKAGAWGPAVRSGSGGEGVPGAPQRD